MSSSRALLRLVERAPYSEQVDLGIEAAATESHSLQALFPACGAIHPEIARYFIRRYTQSGELVLDPACGSGSATVEASIQGRLAIGVDRDSLLLSMARSRSEAADLAEVALFLQMVNLKRPVDVRQFTIDFGLFYDVETFCELVNLKAFIRQSQNRVGAFVGALAASILHGHTNSYLSVYSSPEEGMLPAEQARLNRKRAQIPDYRSVSPRILKRAAWVLRDGLPSGVEDTRGRGRFLVNDAGNLASVMGGNSASLLITSMARVLGTQPDYQSWLQRWFTGCQSVVPVTKPTSQETLEGRLNELLLEWASVTKSGARAVLDVGSGDTAKALGQVIERVASQHLSRYWEINGLVMHQPKSSEKKNCLKGEAGSVDNQQRIVSVLRRR